MSPVDEQSPCVYHVLTYMGLPTSLSPFVGKEASKLCLCRATMTRALKEALLQHFIHQKLEIAYAINKPFPFFEGLRDNFFITERLYRVSHLVLCHGNPPPPRMPNC
ncbi:hypothetical protein Celaphus_00014964 [Cervus elaphus hippelaphus]|uniref:HSR domain-containing protein n=1 Tax=Cervus elaphus hippelaphus TaxID=46360 RepID=A0A212D2V7_CEREH|nr:hypothetical protein Celaphus_00014964 [Cervus elaphus hippelaphus]